MPIKVTCPKCGGVLHAPEDSAGKRGRCPTCTTVLTIPAEGSSGFGIPPVAGPPASPTAPGAPTDTPFRPSGGPARPGLTETGDVPQPGNRVLTAPRPENRPFPDARLPAGVPPANAAPPSSPRIPEPNRQTFVPPADDDEPRPRVVRGWKRVRRGLGLIRVAAVFAFLVPVAVAGLVGYEQYGSPLPDQPGKLGVDGLNLAGEIRLATVAVPGILSILFTLFGRISLVGAPRGSMARGLARFSALATAFAIAGLVLAVFPTAVELADGTEISTSLFPAETQSGAFQRFGVVVGLTLAGLAQVWLLAGLGKMGVVLRSRRLASRSGGLLILGGLLTVLLAATAVGYIAYPSTLAGWWQQYAAQHWAKVGEHQPIVRAGVIVVVGFVVMLLYVRMVGAGSRAIREWLDKNAPVS